MTKKKKEATGTNTAQGPIVVAPPPPQMDGVGLHAPATGSSSRGPEARPHEEVIPAADPALEALALTSPAEVPKAPESTVPSAAPDALEEALSMLNQLSSDLQGADRRRVSGRLELISGWFKLTRQSGRHGARAWRP